MNYKKLINVSKPVRYIDNEINAVKKDVEGKLRFCLSFPDIYELGMSHIGFKMLYERLNDSEDVYCERFFMPWSDAVETFGSEIFTSLETYTPLKQFHFIGFSFQYEMSYTNVLQTLIKSEIPLHSAERTENDPIIIAGGSCTSNPAPMALFIDAFFIGEMEGDLPSNMEKAHEIIKNGGTRADVLRYLNTLSYVYVPSIEPEKKVVRNVYMGYSEDVTIDKLIVPAMPATQDRVAVEISRGCTRGCRFCQAGMIYRPAREKDIKKIAEDALNQLKNTGYEEVSLLSLSAADYSCLEPMLIHMANLLKNRKVSLSLPSLRADKIDDYIFRELSRVRKSGFTIAPEAGSQRMRDVVNKNLTEEEIINAVKKAKDAGWNGAKLYFMIGLPTETDEDIKAIGELAAKVKYAVGRGRFNIRVSVSNFVPKPHTPFQWMGMDKGENLERKRKIIFEELKKHKIQGSYHDTCQSLLEAALSRGTAEMAKVLQVLAEDGAYFDSWGEHFSYVKWVKAFEKAGVSMDEMCHRTYSYDEKLPWHMINSGVSEKYLMLENEKALKEEATPDCKLADCTGCGICDFKVIKNVYASSEIANDEVAEITEESQMFKIVFSKKKRQSLLSALECVRIFTHAFRIADVQLDYTQGFNPGPKIRYQLPAPGGIECEKELLFFEALPSSVQRDLLGRLNDILPEGLNIESIAEFYEKLKNYDTSVTYTLGEKETAFLREKLIKDEAYYTRVDKKGRDKKVDLKDFMLSFEENTLIIAFRNLGMFNPLEFFLENGMKIEEVELNRSEVGLIDRL